MSETANPKGNPTPTQLADILEAIQACAISVKETASDITAERCAAAALSLAQTYAILR